MRWYPVELHTHTCHSDGSFTVEALVDAAARNGYRALALTDHNTSSGVSRMAALASQKGILRYGDWSGPHITAIWWCWRKTVIPTGEA